MHFIPEGFHLVGAGTLPISRRILADAQVHMTQCPACSTVMKAHAIWQAVVFTTTAAIGRTVSTLTVRAVQLYRHRFCTTPLQIGILQLAIAGS